MSIRIILLVIIVCSNITAQSNTLKVLFIGNSYTSVNNLPQITADIALSMGDTLIFDSYALGGYTLDDHFIDSVTINKISSGNLDYVVLQEQSQLPAFENYFSNGPSNLSTLTDQFNPCSRTMFYMTWGRQNGDQSNCAAWPPVCTYEGMDSLLNLRYVETAMMTHAELSPVGVVWRYIRENYPSIQLYQSDGSHPTEAGSYLAACTFYSALFKKDITPSTYNYTLVQADADIIRNAAKTIVFDSLLNWDYVAHTPLTQFAYSIGNGTNEIILKNNSLEADYFEWNFGDGNFSNDTNAIHNYISDGTYQITLTSTKCDLDQMNNSIYTSSVTFCAHTPTIIPDNLLVCPMSTDTLWTQLYDSYQWLDEQHNPIPGETNQYILPQGNSVYSVIATENNCTEISAEVPVQFYSLGLVFYWLDNSGPLLHPDTVCERDTIKLFLTPNKPDSEFKKIEWYKDGQLLTGNIQDTLIVTSTGNYSVSLYRSICPDYPFFESLVFSYTFIDCNIDIDEIRKESLISAFPNPVNDIVTIDIPLTLSETNYLLYDLTGRHIASGQLKKGFNYVDMENYNPGVYYMTFENKSDQQIKIMKN